MQTDRENPQAAPTLSGFLEEVALIADIDNLDQDGNHVMLMTLHSAKGLEFPIVYMTGLEDGLESCRPKRTANGSCWNWCGRE